MVDAKPSTVRIWLSVIMIAVCISSIWLFFGSDTLLHNSNPWKFIFNQALWNQVDSHDVMLGIITTSSAIVAIGFSINHITYSKIFDNFSSRSFQEIFDSQHFFDSFIALILIIVFSIMLLLVINSIPPTLEFLFTTILVNGFIYSLGLFYESFHKTFRFLNKLEIIVEVKSRAISNMESLDDEK
ncbi:MAG: hypothetical protein ACYDAJ_06910 [Nitrosotalea sp.]